MAIDWLRLKRDIIEAAVIAVNASLYIGEERALKDVPVRGIFKGGKQTVRFKTAQEIEADKALRSRLGLAPEILATPERVAALRSAGVNPKRSVEAIVSDFRADRVVETTAARLRHGGERTPTSRGGTSVGLARTIAHFSDDPRRNAAGLTRADRGLTKNRPNRANAFMPFDEDMRLINTQLRDRNRLEDPEAERYLTSRGRYELRVGRAIRDQSRVRVDLATGRIYSVQTERERIGGGLRSTIRIVKATMDTYPVIEGWLVAGDREHDYAKYQELGTRHNAAHPFLRPRLPEWKEELPKQLLRSLGRTGR